jgi:hypothetical protein
LPRASGAKRGDTARKSVASNVVFVSIVPVRNPAPSGLNGTKPIDPGIGGARIETSARVSDLSEC